MSATRACVLGGGSWGTTFAKVLIDAGTPTTLWARDARVVAAICRTHENPEYLPGVALPQALTATTDVAAALAGADLAVLAVPSAALRASMTAWRPHFPEHVVFVSLIKGIETGTTLRMSQLIAEVTGADAERIAVVSGPNLAREVAAGQPAATVVACTSRETARRVQAAASTGYLRPYTNADVVGCELGGAAKNVIALGAGMAEGLGFGDNTRASLITRGLAEITRLGAALGADPQTLAGLAGLGDIVATCSSPLSRNHAFGARLGRGETVEQAWAHTARTVEGVWSSRSILELARRHGVDMPITEHVVAVVHQGLPVLDAVRRLFSREAKAE